MPKKVSRYSLERNRKAIEGWLSNAPKAFMRLEVFDQPMSRRAVMALLRRLSKTDSAFLTYDGAKLCVLVGKDPWNRDRIYTFSKSKRKEGGG